MLARSSIIGFSNSTSGSYSLLAAVFESSSHAKSLLAAVIEHGVQS